MARIATGDPRQLLLARLEWKWGAEKLDRVSNAINEAFDGLTYGGVYLDGNLVGATPKPATDAIFSSKYPEQLLEYLADPMNKLQARIASRFSSEEADCFVRAFDAKMEEVGFEPYAISKQIEKNTKKPTSLFAGAVFVSAVVLILHALSNYF